MRHAWIVVDEQDNSRPMEHNQFAVVLLGSCEEQLEESEAITLACEGFGIRVRELAQAACAPQALVSVYRCPGLDRLVLRWTEDSISVRDKRCTHAWPAIAADGAAPERLRAYVKGLMEEQ